MKTNISYNNETIASFDAGQLATILCNKKKMKSDLKIITEAPVLEEIIITENGEYVSSEDGYSKVEVNVSIPDGYIIPEGQLHITNNGSHDVTEYASVEIKVPIPDGYIVPSGTKEITANGTYDITDKASVVVAVPGEVVEEWDGTGIIIEAIPVVNLIAFTIDGTSYQAEEEMTWAQWCDSDYNTGDVFKGYRGYIVKSSNVGYHISLNGTDPVLDDDYIQALQYTIVYIGGGSGAV